MGNSSLPVETILDEQAARGIYDPRNAPSGFNLDLILGLVDGDSGTAPRHGVQCVDGTSV